MKFQRIAPLLLVVVFALWGFQVPKGATAQPRLSNNGPAPVMFEMTKSPGAGNSGWDHFDCSYVADNKKAVFGIQLKVSNAQNSLHMSGAEGRFVAIAGSENAGLLRSLKTALDAKIIPSKSLRVAELQFDAVVLARNRSRNDSGGYSSNPRGDWIAMKVFLPKGGDDGELFLNFNPVLGEGEFSIKDSDYGDYLLQQLAKVL